MTVLTPMLDDVRTLIYRFALDEADRTLDAIEGRARILRRLDDLEAELKGSAADPAVQAILQQFAPARKLVRLQLDTAADQALQNILTAIGALSAPAQQKVTPQRRALQLETARAQRGARGETLRTRFADWFAAVRGETVRWILLPVLYLALLASLVWVGFQVLYVQNVSFGANRLADYLSLVFWGISSDVASKALSGVRTLWVR
jgi:hypothetical protein